MAEREIVKDLLAHLVAAHSLLAAAVKHGAKNAAPSNKMFDMMLKDYAYAIERGRAYLKGTGTDDPASVMQSLASMIDAQINGVHVLREYKTAGFLLVVFPFGSVDHRRMDYVASAKVEDMRALFKETLARIEGRMHPGAPETKQ